MNDRKNKKLIWVNCIKKITCTMNGAAAEIERTNIMTGESIPFVVVIRFIHGEGYVCYDGQQNRIETYASLPETIYSDFFEEFRMLEKILRAQMQHSTLPGSIFDRIELKNTQVDNKNGIISGVTLFQYEDMDCAAVLIRDHSEEIPKENCSIFINDQLSEEYEALYKAIDSEYYPILAELSNQMERQEERVQQ